MNVKGRILSESFARAAGVARFKISRNVFAVDGFC
jgi:hypothetical protein